MHRSVVGGMALNGCDSNDNADHGLTIGAVRILLCPGSGNPSHLCCETKAVRSVNAGTFLTHPSRTLCRNLAVSRREYPHKRRRGEQEW